MSRKYLLSSLALLGSLLPIVAQAATTTTNFQVTITITASCTVSATNLNFGNSGFLAANIDQTSTITVTCTPTTPYSVGLDQGVNGGSVTTRQMNGPGGLINYALFSDAGRTTNWGNTPPTDTVAGIGSGIAQNLTVFGRVPPQATPAPGAYTDTILVTVTY